MSEKLKPCKFCGGKLEIFPLVKDSLFSINCTKCEQPNGTVTWNEIVNELIAITWNVRTSEKETE